MYSRWTWKGAQQMKKATTTATEKETLFLEFLLTHERKFINVLMFPKCYAV